VPDTPDINADVPWERADRNLNTLPDPATIDGPVELDHYDINARWQTLNFVIEGREIVAPYRPGNFVGQPFATKQDLVTNLRYAAGVELAVIHEYLAAAYSLRSAGMPSSLSDDVIAARAELLRVAASEMRHVRAVNDVLKALNESTSFTPALRVASRIPAAEPGTFRTVTPRPATPQAIQDFIDLERPSISIDGLYARILATLERDGTDETEQTIRSVMAEGQEHFETFGFIQEWLSRHNPSEYLRAANLVRPPAGNLANATLQQRYRALLERLFDGYSLGIPSGAADINAARGAMLGNTGIEGAAEVVAAAGFLVVFDPINDPRFAPVNNP
jgi:rubrerythrin